MKFKTVFLIFLILGTKLKLYSQDVNSKADSIKEQIRLIKIAEENYRKSNDSIGIWIPKNQFDSLVSTYSELKDNEIAMLNYKELMIVVRLYNTIAFRHMTSVEKYKLFNAFYNQHYSHVAVTKLEANISKGMCFYSKKHDIYIGWGVLPNNNSLYFFPF